MLYAISKLRARPVYGSLNTVHFIVAQINQFNIYLPSVGDISPKRGFKIKRRKSPFPPLFYDGFHFGINVKCEPEGRPPIPHVSALIMKQGI